MTAVTVPVLLLLMYHMLLSGRNTARSDFPSPSKSPTTGTSPAVPHWTLYEVPPPLLGRT